MNDLEMIIRESSLEELVLTRLREAIVSGTLKPGQAIDQVKLAKALGVSRTPVRQALRVLETINLVTVTPNGNLIVAELSLKEIEEISYLRLILEGPIAHLAAQKRSLADIKKVASILDEMTRESNNSDHWMQLDKKFHISIYSSSGINRAIPVIRNLRDDTERYVRTYINIENNIGNSNMRHMKIFQAYKNGDAEECEAQTRKHIHEFISIYKAALEK
jgi:DNA-binding GntR family transcriptional regulator